MIAVALKGLAGRKVRALLTAFAVVIGVSMVSGTFILTDTMQKTFDGLFAASYDEDRRGHRGQADRREVDERLGDDPRLAARRGPRAARGRGGRRHGRRRRKSNAADIIGRDGKAVAQESIGGEHRRRQRRASARSGSRRGDWPEGPGQVVDRRRHRRASSTTRSATRVKVATPGKTATLPDHRHRLVRRRRLARLRQHRGLGRPDRPGAARARGPLRLDLDRRQGRHVAGGARRAPCGRWSRHARGQGQRQAGRGGLRAGRQGHVLHPLLPARLRRHRAVRRRVRDLQHALDHRRPAHARVRDAADARRLAQAGPALGPARGPRDRAARVRRSACSSGSGSRKGMLVLFSAMGVDLPEATRCSRCGR